MSVGVVHKVRFTLSNSKKFKNYINYIGRDEATRVEHYKDFSLYNDYMGNPKKLGSLFTKNKDVLNIEEANKLKELFALAQKNNSIMWQDVFSFDNEWLEKQGLYDSKTHAVDEDKVRDTVRNTMGYLVKNENLDTLLWSASLHYNTDNIHVHIASVELDPSRERGKRKPKTLVNMKGKFVNNIIDRQDEYKKINDIIRKNIIETDKSFDLQKDRNIKIMVKEIIKNLPKDKRQWHYNYNSLANVRPMLDKLTKYYIDNYKEKEFKELNDKLDKEELTLKEIYGEGESFRYKDYKKNKLDDLYTRMGNSILKEIKNSAKNQKHLNKNAIEDNRKSDFKKQYTSQYTATINRKDINRIKNIIGNDLENFKNQKAYRELQSEIEREN